MDAHLGHTLERFAVLVGSPRKTMLPPQLVAQLGQQRIVDRGGQVARAQGQRIRLPPRAAAQQHGHAQRARMQDHGNLGRGLVGAINDDGVRARKHLRDILRRNEIIHPRQPAFRIDRQHPLRHRVNLGLPQRRRQRVDLPVDVGFGNMVQVDQGQRPHPAARQRLDGPGPDAAKSGHRHMGVTEAGRSLRAIQAGERAETAVHVGGFGKMFRGVHGEYFMAGGVYGTCHASQDA
ncbi:hypothetical protein D3C85_1209530 [compost metagenome]